MGIEAFGVTLAFTEKNAQERLLALMRSRNDLHFLKEKLRNGDNLYWIGEINDGKHIVELELRSAAVASGDLSLAVRFSLCSYDSIDKLFIDFIEAVVMNHEAEVWLMTSALKNKSQYLPGDTRWLLAALPDEIKAMRASWQRMVGPKQGIVRVCDSFSFVGIK